MKICCANQRFIAGIPASNACCTAPTWFETFISPASSCTNARCASFSNTLSNMALLLPDPEEVLITTGSIPVPGPSKFCPLKLAKPPRWAPMLMKGTSFNDRFWEEASWRKKGMAPFEMPGSRCSWPEVKAKIGAKCRQLPLQGGSIAHSLAIANNRAMPAPRSPAAWKKPLIGVPIYNGIGSGPKVWHSEFWGKSCAKTFRDSWARCWPKSIKDVKRRALCNKDWNPQPTVTTGTIDGATCAWSQFTGCGSVIFPVWPLIRITASYGKVPSGRKKLR